MFFFCRRSWIWSEVTTMSKSRWGAVAGSSPRGQHDEPSSPGLSLTKGRHHKCAESCSRPGWHQEETLLKPFSDLQIQFSVSPVYALEEMWGQVLLFVIQIMGWQFTTSSALPPVSECGLASQNWISEGTSHFLSIGTPKTFLRIIF